MVGTGIVKAKDKMEFFFSLLELPMEFIPFPILKVALKLFMNGASSLNEIRLEHKYQYEIFLYNLHI